MLTFILFAIGVFMAAYLISRGWTSAVAWIPVSAWIITDPALSFLAHVGEIPLTIHFSALVVIQFVALMSLAAMIFGTLVQPQRGTGYQMA